MPIQCKLTVGAPDDPLEDEADVMADKIMRMPEQSFIQRKCAHCEEEEKENVQRKPSPSFIQRKESSGKATGIDSISTMINSTKGNGTGIDTDTRSFMESRFGTEFRHVNIHTDIESVQMNKDLGAKAFTTGNDIYFNQGEYEPGSSEGRHLLAHELTHILQQNGTKPSVNNFLQLRRSRRQIASAVQVLNTQPYTSTRYRRVVSEWPSTDSIWNVLTTPEAKINFVHYILSFDETNCVLIDATDSNVDEGCSATASAVTRFRNACQGYAAQMYARYTSSERLSTTAVSALDTDAHITVGSVPVKLQMPIKIVTVPGHAFNAVLINENPEDINAWLFFEPQLDRIFFGSDPQLRSADYAGAGIFTIGRITDYRNSQFIQSDEQNFMLDNRGREFRFGDISEVQRVGLVNIFRDIFIADDRAAYTYATTHPAQTYEQYIAAAARTSSLEHLALAFTYLDGRKFRRTVNGPLQTINRRIFLQLVNRPGLESVIAEPGIPAGPPPVLVDPFDDEPNWAQTEYASQLREAALAPLFRSRPDSRGFTNRLRTLSPVQSTMLAEDTVFFELLRTRGFNTQARWIIFINLVFNYHLREPFLQLNNAVLVNNARLLADMLSIVIFDFHNDSFYAFLRGVISDIFRGNSLLPELLRLIDHRNDPGISQRFSGDYREIHYEKNAAGQYVLKRFTGHMRAHGYVSGNDLRVIVRMRFVDGSDRTNCATSNSPDCSPFLFQGRYAHEYNEWQSVITEYWNDKFSITNGVITHNIKFVPLFLAEPDEQTTNIRIMTDNSQRCSTTSIPGRASQTCWFINKMEDNRTVAHEFGHIIGATDEYNLPGSYKEITDAAATGALDLTDVLPEDMMLTTKEGIEGVPRAPHASGEGYDIDSLMGSHRNSGEVHTRHLTRLLRLVNAGRDPVMPPFEIRKKT